ncbi:MAG TPA: magnesium transporter CorA family protein [Pseudonocardia sp.]|jgi:magnesium transporter|nr:magnesium transporter CorA family protein [Pseudonocardia sp.]
MTVSEIERTGGSSEAVHSRVYRKGELAEQNLSPADLSATLGDGEAVAWLDVVGPRPQILQELAQVFDLHPLAVEDALAEPQRPKLDQYPGHLFIAAYLPCYDPETYLLDPAELSIFVTERALITVRTRPDALDADELTRRWSQDGGPSCSVASLLHGLLDYVVDEQYAMTRKLEEAVDDLEESLFDDPSANGTDVQRRGFLLRKSLTRARRVAHPTTDLLFELCRPGVGIAGGELAPYYADVRDHAVRSAERLDSLREMVGTVLDTRLALRGDQLNEIMKKLTGWAAIIAVPTAVTGFYGQNVPYPGFQQWSGFVASIGLTAAMAIVLFVVFRRRNWL